jgi:hypothetical protein
VTILYYLTPSIAFVLFRMWAGGRFGDRMTNEQQEEVNRAQHSSDRDVIRD